MVSHPIPAAALSRRALLLAASTAAALTALPSRASAEVVAGGLPLLAPLPPGAPDRALFAPIEQRFASYLATLPAMVNDIEDTDPATYGFMRGGWWREPSSWFNSRVQEHVFTLSWFHANSRRWNPYRGDAALAGRLDAALQHYLSLQHADGAWPEYSRTEHSLAATGFGLGYLAKTLDNLRRADALPQRRQAIEQALRRGMQWLLDPGNGIWGTPVAWANQVAAGLAGSTVALQLTPDADLQRRLLERIEYFAEHSQSPAGFFYEPQGSDINYNFEVMLPEIAEIYLRTGSRPILSMARRFTDWFGYNLLREPDGSGWLTYYAVSARTSVAYYDDVVPDPDRTNLASMFVPAIPNLGAFFTSREDRAASRAAWAAEPGPAPVLAKQNTSPRIIAHTPYGEHLPTDDEKRRAIRALPYLRLPEFAELRRDSVVNQDYLYVRRPGLYFGGFFGTRPTSTVRSGTGFLWHPRAGTIVHAQQTDTGCWSTVLPNGNPDGRSNLVAEYFIGDRAWTGEPRFPGSAPVRVRYRIPDGRITTELTVARGALTRSVQVTSAATEQIPLVLQPDDEVAFTDGTPAPYGQTTSATADGLVLRRNGAVITFRWGTPRHATLNTSSRTYLRDGRRRVHVLRIPHDGRFEVHIGLS